MNSIEQLRRLCEKYIDDCNFHNGGIESVYNDAFLYCLGKSASKLLLIHFNIEL